MGNRAGPSGNRAAPFPFLGQGYWTPPCFYRSWGLTPEEASMADDSNDILNPHRSEEQLRTRERVADLLSRRGVLLFGDETGEELADLWSSVERFESLVEARGGDTMTNAPDSSEPDNPRFVLPERRARENAGDYTRRILEAATELTEFER